MVILKITTKKLHETLTSFRSAVKAFKESNNMNSYQPFIIKDELGDFQINFQSRRLYSTRSSISIQPKRRFRCSQLYFNHRKQQYILILSKERNGTIRYENLNLDGKRIVGSTIFYETFVSSQGTKICYSKALVCLIISNDNNKVNFYHLTSSDTKYIESSNLFVIVNSKETVNIYEVVNRAETLRIHHCLIQEIGNRRGNVTLEDNIILIARSGGPQFGKVIETTYEEVKRRSLI